MKIYSIILIILLVIIFFVAAASLSWHLLGVESLARTTLLHYLQRTINLSLDASKLSLNLRGMTLDSVRIELTPSLKLSVDKVRLRLPSLFLLIGGLRNTSLLEEVNLIAPHLNFSISSDDTSRTPGLEYKPFPLKPLSNMKFLRLLTIENALISVGQSKFAVVDSITGRIDFSNLTNVDLSIEGRLKRLPGARLEIDGNADLTEGSFLLIVQAFANNLGEWAAPEDYKYVKLSRGSLSLKIEIRGTEDLRLAGAFDLDSLSFELGERYFVEEGNFHGELFGAELQVMGECKINGLLIPLKLNIEDLLNPAWTAEIAQTELNLADMRWEGFRIGETMGTAMIEAELSGIYAKWEGIINLEGQNITVNRIKIDEISTRLEIDTTQLVIGDLTARVFDGILRIGGVIDPSSEISTLDLEFVKTWTATETDDFMNIEGSECKLTGSFRKDNDTWKGAGSGWLLSADGDRILDCEILFREPLIKFLVNSPVQKGRFSGEINIDADPLTFELGGKDVNHLIRTIIDRKYLPEIINNYSLNLNISGNEKRQHARFSAINPAGDQGLSFEGTILYEKTGFSTHGVLDILLPGGNDLRGKLNISYLNGWLKCKNTNLNNSSGKELLKTGFSYNLTDHYWGAITLNLDSLPVMEVARLVIPTIDKTLSGYMSGQLSGKKDSLTWNGQISILYPDSAQAKTTLQGSYDEGIVEIKDFSYRDVNSDEYLFSLTGKLDYRRRSFDSLLVRVQDFPLERVLQLVSTAEFGEFGGALNGRMEIDGSFDHPVIETDIHLTSGILHNIPGYWMNFRSITLDSSYTLKTFDFGKDITGLIKITGEVDRFNKDFHFQVKGAQVEVGDIVEITTGERGPLEGKCDLEMNVSRTGELQLLDAEMTVAPGRLGTLPFDRVQINCSTNNLLADDPVLTLNEATIDWGTARGDFSGTISLSDERDIDIMGNVKGNLIGLLQRLSPFFSDPQGNGDLTFKIGGNLNNPRLTEGRFHLFNSSIRLKKVVKEIEAFNADIELNNDGEVRVNKLEGLVNGQPFMFGNRRSEKDETAMIIGGYDFGILQLKTGKEGVRAVIPSLMRDDWGGYIRVSGMDKQGSFEMFGPAERPLGVGELRLINATFTYPFLKTEHKSKFVTALVGFLKRMRWDGFAIPYQGCRYDREISGFGKGHFTSELLDVDLKLFVDILIEDNREGLHFTGSVMDTLHIRGELISTVGSVEYLDLDFDVDELGVVFNPVELQPIFYGGVKTEVVDSLGIPREIRGVIRRRKTLDHDESESTIIAHERGRWNEITFMFEDDRGQSQEQILAMLGYSPEALPGKLVGLGSKLVSDATPIRRWTRTLERQVERWLGVDRVDIKSSIAENFIERQFQTGHNSTQDNPKQYSYLQTLDNSQVTVGKYLTRSVYISYTGSLLSESDVYDITRLGVVHNWDLLFRLYQIAPNLVLNYRYEYDSLSKFDDNRVLFRFHYTFK